MTDLPDGWNRVTLNDLGNWVTGSTPQSKDPLNFGDEVEFVTPSDIGYGGRLGVVERRISELGASRVRKLKAPSVNLVCIGTIGKVALANREVTTNQQINSLEPNESVVLPNFAMWLLASPKIQEALWQASSSTTVAILNKGNLCKIETSIPPLPEQHKIVEILENHLSRLDAALTDVKQAKVKAAQFRRSLLQAAFTGNLAQNEYDPDFPLVKIGEVSTVEAGKTPKNIADKGYATEFSDGLVPFYKVGDMNASDVFMKSSRIWISQSELRDSNLKLVPIGAVVFPKAGGAIATNKKRIIGVAGAIDLNCMSVVAGENLNAKYLYYWMESLDLRTLSNGSILPQISKNSVEETLIPLPTLDEQSTIVEMLENHLSRLDASVAVADAMEKQSVGLRRSLLQAAFTGQLTKEVASV